MKSKITYINVLPPLFAAMLGLITWEFMVIGYAIPPYVLPAPTLVLLTLYTDSAILFPALWITLQVTFLALLLAIVGGVLLALVFNLSPWLRHFFNPFAVILQVTPIIAIAPLILIYAPNTLTALLICAWVIAFFPILANTMTGLGSISLGLRDLFFLYGANRWQTMRYLLIPGCLPYFLVGLKISSGLALVGTVAAEYAAGATGQQSGLASRILESAFRLNMPRMFAALLLVALSGLLIYWGSAWISRALLQDWHESEM